MIERERDIIDYLGLPSIPKKEWDGRSGFRRGIAVTSLLSGGEAYAVASYDSEFDEEPRIIKVFTLEPYRDVRIVALVPDYMNTDGVGTWDLSPESKAAAESIINEAHELEVEDVREERTDIPKHEYLYAHVTNDNEAKAFIKSWNAQHGAKKARIPKTHEDIITKLTAMWLNDNKKKV